MKKNLQLIACVFLTGLVVLVILLAPGVGVTHASLHDSELSTGNVLRISITDPHTLVVTNTTDLVNGNTTSISSLKTSDGGDGISLREAITAANNQAGTDYIYFNIAGAGPHTITPTSALPTITGAVIIDGTTEPDYVTNGNKPIVVLDGNGRAVNGLVLTSTADGSTIRGLVIRDFGTTTLHDGIEIRAGSDGNTIAGNYIGRLTTTGADAGTGEENAGHGVNILGANNIIGGTTAADRNVISGNSGNGIYIGSTGANNSILGNYIGTTAAGNVALGNQAEGINIDGASGTIIGGTVAGAANVIAAGGAGSGIREGIWIINGASGSKIQGNYIGTDVTGTVNLGSTASGVSIGNSGAPSSNNLIGGTVAGAGNVIAFNGVSGVSIDTSTSGASVNNAVLGNSVYSNTGLGIDLDDVYASPSSAGVTANDPGDADVGGNNRQNFPLLSGAFTNGSQITITGSLNSIPNSYFRIEFFSNVNADSSGYGEGQTYLGSANVATDGSGNAMINATLSASVPVGSSISATATKSDAAYTTFTDTSEFAQNVMAT